MNGQKVNRQTPSHRHVEIGPIAGHAGGLGSHRWPEKLGLCIPHTLIRGEKERKLIAGHKSGGSGGHKKWVVGSSATLDGGLEVVAGHKGETQ